MHIFRCHIERLEAEKRSLHLEISDLRDRLLELTYSLQVRDEELKRERRTNDDLENRFDCFLRLLFKWIGLLRLLDYIYIWYNMMQYWMTHLKTFRFIPIWNRRTFNMIIFSLVLISLCWSSTDLIIILINISGLAALRMRSNVWTRTGANWSPSTWHSATKLLISSGKKK